MRDWGKAVEMTKDDKGVWTFTSEPLDPDIYVYSFAVDGVQVSDPGNTEFKPIVTGGVENLVTIPGAKLTWFEQDVARGSIHRHRYRFKEIGEDVDFLVYTPPGYQKGETRLPTLYLLHGVMETEESWIRVGRAHTILDNLIAQGEAKPMILVMPLGYGFSNVPDRVGEVFSGKSDHRRAFASIRDTLRNEIIPLVEREYGASDRREDRAIAGLSMGGAQALYLATNNRDVFGAAAAFSGAFVMYGGKFDEWLGTEGKAIDLTIACGKQDFLFGINGIVRNWLAKNQVPFRAVDSEGGHTWHVWRPDLEAFAKTLFSRR